MSRPFDETISDIPPHLRLIGLDLSATTLRERRNVTLEISPSPDQRPSESTAESLRLGTINSSADGVRLPTPARSTRDDLPPHLRHSAVSSLSSFHGSSALDEEDYLPPHLRDLPPHLRALSQASKSTEGSLTAKDATSPKSVESFFSGESRSVQRNQQGETLLSLLGKRNQELDRLPASFAPLRPTHGNVFEGNVLSSGRIPQPQSISSLPPHLRYVGALTTPTSKPTLTPTGFVSGSDSESSTVSPGGAVATKGQVTAPPLSTTLRRQPAKPPASAGQRIRTGDAAEWTKNREVIPTETKTYPCPYAKCALGFDELKHLKEHKERSHEYCKKCDMDFEDFDDHVRHKVDNPKHIACRYCGMDFRSIGGRMHHYKTMHPQQSSLTCPGCAVVVVTAGGLIDHIEKNACNKITFDQFKRFQLIHHVQLQTANFNMAELEEDEDEEEEVVEDLMSMADTTSVSSGGVALIPKQGTIDYSVQFPNLGGRASANPERGLVSEPVSMPKTIAMSQSTAWTAGGPSAKALFPAIGIRKSNENTLDESFKKASGDAHTAAATTHGLEPAEMDVDRVRGLTEAAAGMLLGKPRLEPQAPQESQRFPNGQPTETADPFHPLFNPNLFKDVLGRYKCPWPSCTKYFDTEFKFEAHQRSDVHRGLDYRCPTCLKIFRSTTAITQHMEAEGSRCHIKASKAYAQVIEMVSGGLMKIEGQHEDGTPIYTTVEPMW